MAPPRRLRAPALVLGAAMVLGACSSSTVVDRFGPMLADTLTGSQQVAAVVVGTSSILVTYQEATGTRTVQLASESTSTSTVRFPSAAATVFDASTISEVAKKLATSCTDPDQVTRAVAVSSTATSITTTCGTVERAQINNRPLTATGSGWSADDLTILWADLDQVVPAKKVDTISLNSSSVTFWYDSGSIFPECSRVMWTRQFDGTSAGQACLPAAVGAVPKVNMAALTPDRLASVLSLLSASQPSAASRGAIVTSSGDTITVSVTQGSSQKTIEINP